MDVPRTSTARFTAHTTIVARDRFAIVGEGPFVERRGVNAPPRQGHQERWFTAAFEVHGVEEFHPLPALNAASRWASMQDSSVV